MKAEDVLENLKKLIGTPFDADEVICAFEDFTEDGESYVYASKCYGNGYDAIAYVDAVNSTSFVFKLQEDTIADVWME